MPSAFSMTLGDCSGIQGRDLVNLLDANRSFDPCVNLQPFMRVFVNGRLALHSSPSLCDQAGGSWAGQTIT